jgi:hypothetical protein
MRCLCLLLLFALAPQAASARALSNVRTLEAARKLVASGAADWRDYLRWLRGERRSVFERADLAANARAGKFSLLERDRKFALLRDLKARERVERDGKIEAEHLLGIPTWGRRQPTWVDSVARRDAASLGRMVRETLAAPRELHHAAGRETYGYFHMPGGISQPITHFHVRWRPDGAPRIARWDRFVARNYRRLAGAGGAGFEIFEVRPGASARARGWPLIALAAAAAQPASDRLLGEMFVGLARAAIARAPYAAMAAGELQIDGADRRPVVRLASAPLLP